MVANSHTRSLQKPKAFRAIFWGGLIVGVLDITAAFVNSGLRGRSPVWVLQSVAGGWLGVDTFKGGLKTGPARPRDAFLQRDGGGGGILRCE
jgi:hypothetical protein